MMSVPPVLPQSIAQFLCAKGLLTNRLQPSKAYTHAVTATFSTLTYFVGILKTIFHVKHLSEYLLPVSAQE